MFSSSYTEIVLQINTTGVCSDELDQNLQSSDIFYILGKDTIHIMLQCRGVALRLATNVAIVVNPNG